VKSSAVRSRPRVDLRSRSFTTPDMSQSVVETGKPDEQGPARREDGRVVQTIPPAGARATKAREKNRKQRFVPGSKGGVPPLKASGKLCEDGTQRKIRRSQSKRGILRVYAQKTESAAKVNAGRGASTCRGEEKKEKIPEPKSRRGVGTSRISGPLPICSCAARR